MITRLKSMAPWDFVTLLDGFVITKNWQDYDNEKNLKPILKYVEFKDAELTVEQTIDLQSLTKSELAALAAKKNIDVTGMNKSKIIEALNAV